MVVVSITPEIAVDNVTAYAGGLGVLEGDKFIEASKKGLDYLVLSLLYRDGYVDYEIDENGKLIAKHQRIPRDGQKLTAEDKMIITVRGDRATVVPWVYSRGSAKLVLFEVLEPLWLSQTTSRLYIENDKIQGVYKWVLLAKASAEYLRTHVGIENIDVIDLQEAYTALVIFSLPEFKNFRLIIHTPGPWGHPHIDTQIIEREFGTHIGNGIEMLTRIALQRVSKAFAVSRKHYEICRTLFYDYRDKLSYVTNGVSEDRWRHRLIKSLVSEKGGEERVLAEEFWRTHLRIKRELVETVIKRYKPGIEVEDSTPIVVWCRRITRYKRPYFISQFIEEVGRDLDVLFVVGGKPHPADSDGIRYAEEFVRLSKRYENVVYIHDYSVEIAQLLLSGGDLLTYTPFPGWEACGTSYMKAALNGVPTLGSRDGGILEMVVEGFNGWLYGLEVDTFINIYGDSRASDIDRVEYEEFRDKLLEIIRMYGSSTFKEIALNALKTSRRFTMERVLEEYYKNYNRG